MTHEDQVRLGLDGLVDDMVGSMAGQDQSLQFDSTRFGVCSQFTKALFVMPFGRVQYRRCLDHGRRFWQLCDGNHGQVGTQALGLIILMAVAFGCAQHGPTTIDPPPKKISYVIPFEQPTSGLLIVSAVININPDHPEIQPPPTRLAIDAGAAHTCFFVSNIAVADLAKMFPRALLDERLSANGSLVKVCHFQNARVTVGNLTVDMPVDASAYDMTVNPSFDGVVGVDFLSRFNVQIDFPAKTMTLTER